MAKPSRQRWIEQWMRGGLASIDHRIKELNEELTHLETVRKALEPLTRVVAGSPAPAKKAKPKKKSKAKTKPTKPFVPGELQARILKTLTYDKPLTAVELAKTLKMKKLEGIYTPLYRLEREGLVERMPDSKIQIWRKV